MDKKAVLTVKAPMSSLYMVGDVYVKRLKNLGINTIEDLINHYPSRYEDFSLISKISLLQKGETVTIQGFVNSIKNIITKNGKMIQEASVVDESGKANIIWFNQPFLVNTIKEGEKVSLSGKVDFFGRKLVLYSPEYEILKQKTSAIEGLTIHTGRIVPVYPETYGISSKWLRSKIFHVLPLVLPQINDYLPTNIREKYQFYTLREALKAIHFPKNDSDYQNAKTRLAFDELFLIQVSSLKRKAEWKKETVGNQFNISKFKKNILEIWENLPFELTNAQNRVIQEIFNDLEKNIPMNRLLQGDVGSGKTVVAAITAYLSYLNNCQTAFMAPTEILSKQHFETIKKLLSPLGVKVGLITSSTNKKQNDNNDYDIYIGTHALLSEKMEFNKLGLIIIDEQHKFGVEQRTKLKEKGINPHLLSMTATPIPRTVALTLYQELDLSIIDEMPKGRRIVKTWVVPEEKRLNAYKWIEDKIIKEKVQCFIVCPLIEESESKVSIKAVTKEFQILKNKVFPKLKLGLLHGRLKNNEKDLVLKNLSKRKVNILVSTPVVEVGIDIPNATIMLIEGADRFGLASLHQLRGRVGRGEKQSFCLLFTESQNDHVKNRLKLLENINVGSKLAEADLKIRGPGDIFGIKQHGIPSLKIADFNNLNLIQQAKNEAEFILKEDPDLTKNVLINEKIKLQEQIDVSSN